MAGDFSTKYAVAQCKRWFGRVTSLLQQLLPEREICHEALCIGHVRRDRAVSYSFAGPATFTFDPNDLINLVGSDTSQWRGAQDNPRAIFDPVAYGGGNYNNWAFSYYQPTVLPSGGPQPERPNHYLNWLDSLGSGEGIMAFNMWVTTAGYPNNPYDGNPTNPWNQQIYRDGTNGNTSFGLSGTADAANGWSARVVDIYAGTYGIEWYTTDPSKYLRPGGVDLSSFGFTILDSNAVVGQQYRIWFGSESTVFDAVGWGTRDAGGLTPFAETGQPANWNAVLTIEAGAVPEPASLSLLGLSTLLLRRRR